MYTNVVQMHIYQTSRMYGNKANSNQLIHSQQYTLIHLPHHCLCSGCWLPSQLSISLFQYGLLQLPGAGVCTDGEKETKLNTVNPRVLS